MKHFKDYRHKNLIKIHSPFVKKLMKDDKFLKALDTFVKVDHNHQIPYLAGYSISGKTIYFDKNFWPKRFCKYQGRVYDTTDFILLHEVGEKYILDRFHFTYQVAHHIITHIELKAVDDCKFNSRVYTKFLHPFIEQSYNQKFTNVPKDYDMTPLICEKEHKLIKQIMANRKK